LSQINSKIPVFFIKCFFQKVVSAILYLFSGKILFKNTKNCISYGNFLTFLPLNSDPGSGFPIRIRIHKVSGSGSTTLKKMNRVFRAVLVLGSFFRRRLRAVTCLAGLPGGRRHGHFPHMWQFKIMYGREKFAAVSGREED
jgi:hypothetical protein